MNVSCGKYVSSNETRIWREWGVIFRICRVAYIYESYPIRMSHVIYEYVVWRIFMSHVLYAWVCVVCCFVLLTRGWGRSDMRPPIASRALLQRDLGLFCKRDCLGIFSRVMLQAWMCRDVYIYKSLLQKSPIKETMCVWVGVCPWIFSRVKLQTWMCVVILPMGRVTRMHWSCPMWISRVSDVKELWCFEYVVWRICMSRVPYE